LYKIDLKSFRQKNYQQLGGKLDNVLASIRTLKGMGIWVEVVTLTIPGFNDSDEELKDIAGFLASVSPDIPWHVTAFHQDYRMTDPDDTPVETLLRAAEIGYSAGLKFVYAGNLPGNVGRYENTYCPQCGELLIERSGFTVLKNRLNNGTCPKCHAAIPGVWN
jgi:pyruvate formate lyase activating enzyme